MWTRREMLAVAGMTIFAPAALRSTEVVGGSATAALTNTFPGDLPNPRTFRSVDGVLSAELALNYHSVNLPSGPASLRLYNGGLPGPTWVVRPGDRLEVKFTNDLPDIGAAGASGGGHHKPMNNVSPGELNKTNLHFHGMHVDPRGRSDNVFLTIEPGTDFDYLVQVPDDHPIGTFWYHPHRHGSVALQVASGMAGMIVVEDPSQPIGIVERHMVIQSPIVGPDGRLENAKLVMALEAERIFTINGHYQPRIHIREGEVQHWRLVSANDSQFLPLDLEAIEGVDFAIISRDGNALGAAEPVDKILMAPGNRLDLLVTGTRQGIYPFARDPFEQGLLQMPAASLGDIVVLPPARGTANSSGFVLPVKSRLQRPIAEEEVQRYRTLELGHVRKSGDLLDVEFTINGKPHQPDVFDIVAKVGAAEEWTLVNLTPFPHPIHIHVNPFEVIEINGEVMTDRRWLDTVIVPAAGVVKFRTRFEDFHGDFVMHCHILPHEDAGMMINVRILP